MKKIITILCCLFVACASSGTSGLRQEVERIAAQSDAIVGVAALDLDTGRRFELRGDERFPMGSVYKYPIAAAFLRMADTGKLSLSDRITITPAEFRPSHSPLAENAKGEPVTVAWGRLVTLAVADSDNTAADRLLETVTPKAVMTMLASLGITGMDISRTEGQINAELWGAEGQVWNRETYERTTPTVAKEVRDASVARFAVDPRDTSTPNAMLAFLASTHRKHLGLTENSHQLLMGTLTNNRNPKRIETLLPAGVTVSHKTGTMPGTANDVGIITSPDGKRHIALAIFTKGAKTSSLQAREKVIAEIARAVYDDFTRRR